MLAIGLHPKLPENDLPDWKLSFQDLTFTANPGEVVALVGPSGGGKSSCIALLEHFYEPVAGQILLDGIPIRDYEHKFIHLKVRYSTFSAFLSFWNLTNIRAAYEKPFWLEFESILYSMYV